MKWTLLLAMAFLTGCGPSEEAPPIARSLNLSIGNHDLWAARLAERFPPGTTETEVVRELQAQGFSVDGASKSAKFHWSRLPCQHYLDVSWRTGQDGMITRIGGDHWPACP